MARNFSVLFRTIQILLLFAASMAHAEQDLSFGFIPYVSASALVEFQAPLKQYVASRLGQAVAIVTAQDFDTFLDRTQKREYDIIYTAPHFGRIAQKRDGYIPIAMTSHNVQGYFLVKQDSPIMKLEDLKNRTITIAQRKSILFQMAENQLKKKGLIDGKNITIIEAHSHNNAQYAPISGQSDAAVTGVQLWLGMDPKHKDQLRVIDTTERVPGFFVMANPNLPKATRNKLKQALLGFAETEEGKQYFKKTGFVGMEPLTEKKLKDMDPYTQILLKPAEPARESAP